jgi:predicted RNA methylase
MLLYFIKSKDNLGLLYVRIDKLEDEEIIEENSDLVFGLLIEKYLLDEKSILVFNILRDYNKKINSWILPSKYSDTELIDKCFNEPYYLDSVNKESLINIKCYQTIEIINEELILKDNQNIDLSYWADKLY